MGKKFKVIHDRPGCIGCGACAAVSPKYWVMNEDGKSDIVEGKDLDNGFQEMEITEDSYDENFEAAETCPVNVIHIKDLEEDKDII